MKTIIKCMVVWLICQGGLWSSLVGQSPQEVLDQMNAALGQLEYFQLKVEGKMMFRDESLPAQPFDAELLKTGKYFYSRFLETEMLLSPKFKLTMDQETQRIYVDSREIHDSLRTEYAPTEEEKAAFEELISAKLDTTASMRVSHTSEGDPLLIMEYPEALMAATTIYINKDSGLPYRFEFFYNEAFPVNLHKVVADYQFTSIKKNHQDPRFETDRYIQKQKDKSVVSVGAYQDFQVINRVN